MFKIGDKVVYKFIDERHNFNGSKAKLNNVYTVLHVRLSNIKQIPVIILKEVPQFNYDVNCFELYKPKKLKVRLP